MEAQPGSRAVAGVHSACASTSMRGVRTHSRSRCIVSACAAATAPMHHRNASTPREAQPRSGSRMVHVGAWRAQAAAVGTVTASALPRRIACIGASAVHVSCSTNQSSHAATCIRPWCVRRCEALAWHGQEQQLGLSPEVARSTVQAAALGTAQSTHPPITTQHYTAGWQRAGAEQSTGRAHALLAVACDVCRKPNVRCCRDGDA
jgi:hypothetical protein